MAGRGVGGEIGRDDDVDTDDQEEDQERRALLCHPRPHLAPAGSESRGGNWGEIRDETPPAESRLNAVPVLCVFVCVLSTCDCFVSAPQAPAESLNLILCDPVIVFGAVFLMFAS